MGVFIVMQLNSLLDTLVYKCLASLARHEHTNNKLNRNFNSSFITFPSSKFYSYHHNGDVFPCNFVKE